jgi:hypothetical protein
MMLCKHRDDRCAGQRAVKRLGRRRVITWLAPPAPTRSTGETMWDKADVERFVTLIRVLIADIEHSPEDEPFLFSQHTIERLNALCLEMGIPKPIFRTYTELTAPTVPKSQVGLETVEVLSPHLDFAYSFHIYCAFEHDNGTVKTYTPKRLFPHQRERIIQVLKLWETRIPLWAESGLPAKFPELLVTVAESNDTDSRTGEVRKLVTRETAPHKVWQTFNRPSHDVFHKAKEAIAAFNAMEEARRRDDHVTPTGPAPRPDTKSVEVSAQELDSLVRSYINDKERQDGGIDRITRDGIGAGLRAKGYQVSDGRVSGTPAWRNLAERKKNAKRPDGAPSDIVPSNVDEAIEQGDWDTVKSFQDKEQRGNGRKHK